jgi:hypothetical protein
MYTINNEPVGSISKPFSLLEPLDSDNLTRDQIIEKLLNITPKNTRDYKLLVETDYLVDTSTKQLHQRLMEREQLNLSRTNNIKKTLKEQEDKIKQYNSKDWLGFRLPIDRSKLPINHPLRNPYLPIPTRKSLKWRYSLPIEDYSTQFSYLKIKNLINILMIENESILVVRLDLFGEDEDIDKINDRFNTLLRERAYSFRGYLDYCAVREKGEKNIGNGEEGVHLHGYFFLKTGSSITQFVTGIGNRWLELGGKRWYSRNLDTYRLPDKSEVLGKVQRSDYFKIERLLHCMKYLLKNLSKRDWLIDSEGNKRRSRLFTCSHIENRMWKVHENERLFNLNLAPYSYSWLYRIGLNYNDTVFKGREPPIKKRLMKPVSRYLEKRKVNVEDYKRRIR